MDPLLTPAEAGRILKLSSKALANWASEGKLTAVRNIAGQRRYRASQVYGLSGAEMPRHALDDLDPDTTLTPGDVARLTGVQAATVSRWEREGRLSAVREGNGHRRFKVEDVRRFLEQGR